MHDPMTVAFEIKYPWKHYKNPKYEWEKNYRESFITIWHVDPETDGTDDSCGWFLRSRHLDKQVLANIIKEFEFDWDGVFESDSTKVTYNTGLFLPNGQPHLSVMGVTLNLFHKAIREIFRDKEKDGSFAYQKKAMKYLQDNLADILTFAENPTDSLFNSITRKFETGCNEEYTPRSRRERIESMAGIIYSYIMRDMRPWYKHPKWHIHHWKLQIHPLWALRRWLLTRCCKCGGRFKWGSSGVSEWNVEKTPWYRGEKGLACFKCSGPVSCSPKESSDMATKGVTK